MIQSFTGKFRFLSNFVPSPVEFEGDLYPTVEHAYQAAKTVNPTERAKVRGAVSPNLAKSMGKTVTIRKDWDEIKLDVMNNLLLQKFTSSPYKQLLLDTGNEELVEGNWWGDRFWGKCQGKGENHLGRLLMEIRARVDE